MTRRIDGLDVARAIAVLGMVAAHVGDDGTRGADTAGWHWLWVSHGFPSSLFAVLAGVSMTLMLTRRGTVAAASVGADHPRATRIRIATRGAILIFLGVALTLLGTRIAIVLTALGVCFLLALPLLRWRAWALLAVAGVLVATGGWAAAALREATAGDLLGTTPFDALWADRYPVALWMAYVLVGLVIGRLSLRADATAGALAIVGLAIAVAVSAAAAIASDGSWRWTLDYHSYSPAEALRNLGAAGLVLGASLWVTPRAPRVLWPLRAAGSMALTLYVLQVLIVWIAGDAIIVSPSNVVLVLLCAALVGFACAWRAWRGQGPLEQVVSAVSGAAVETWAPRASAPR
ncbi:heparan-alpha-glucosaminide N-acetyltransferase domain-containing protein [Demequina sp. NBRC 110053]|uniref:heparan-alpha-glucosaminide N-acetyltransferase domain-containing protein n=1 Tax=Demequina sp. NBRC 110053 TaxID=1570342 RepID=UPI001185AF15|nr:heparan-alpha-glucosaminide N-acetyltransferase domain-containing protein [Demequina sp. NBRC 110053]